ncbi:Myosin-J heavy chain protein [Galdieria sulphuraria]|nr:Myosin-J heavy chain protein [Galdieria sulphuraria]
MNKSEHESIQDFFQEDEKRKNEDSTEIFQSKGNPILSESFVQDCSDEGFALARELSKWTTERNTFVFDEKDENATCWINIQSEVSKEPNNNILSSSASGSAYPSTVVNPSSVINSFFSTHSNVAQSKFPDSLYKPVEPENSFYETGNRGQQREKNCPLWKDGLTAKEIMKEDCNGLVNCSSYLGIDKSFTEELKNSNVEATQERALSMNSVTRIEKHSTFSTSNKFSQSSEEHFNRVIIWYPNLEGSWSLGFLTSTGEVLDLKGNTVSSSTTARSEGFNDTKRYHLFHEDDLEDFDDAVELRSLHEAPILDLLRRRYTSEKIYTCVGGEALLVSINPYCPIPGLFNESTMERIFSNQLLGCSFQPHIFSMADAAYRNMLKSKTPQSLIISGESGAGKTEACKFILKYLVFLNDRERSYSSTCSMCKLSRIISEKLLHANPVLEAFGNARTSLNSNSSRFGKLIQIFYCLETGHILSARVRQFLFEKSRVSCASHRFGERNYHIFYQMIAGASPNERQSWLLADSVTCYRYLHGTAASSLNRKEDSLDFERTKTSMLSLGLRQEEMERIFSILSGILALGNVDFICDESETCLLRNPSVLETVCKLLMLDATELSHALTTTAVIVRGERFERRRSVDQATHARDALAKHIYEMVFEYLVCRLNQLLDPSTYLPQQEGTLKLPIDSLVHDQLRNSELSVLEDSTHISFLAILDQSGFEVTCDNSLEQLLINYSNEKLQQQFNDRISQCERQIYDEEDVPFNMHDMSNDDCQNRLDALERRPLGLLHLLDEECLAPRGTDDRFLQKLYDTLQSSSEEYKSFIRISELGRSRGEFLFRHFAGDVVYHTRDIVLKNRDHLHGDLVQVLKNSSNPIFLANSWMFEESDNFSTVRQTASSSFFESSFDMSRNGPFETSSFGSSPLTSTVLSQFRPQLAILMEILSSTSPRYVRCLKPNSRMRPREFIGKDVLRQLECSGVFEYVRLRRIGLPVRVPHDDFFYRFKNILYGIDIGTQNVTLEFLLERIVARADTIFDKRYAIGRSKVFVSDELYKYLEHMRFGTFTTAAIRIQKQWKMCLLRREFLILRHRVIFAQSLIRCRGPRNTFLRVKCSCKRIEAVYLMWQTKIEYERLRNATLVFQKLTRRWIACNLERLKVIRAATVIQRHFRSYWIQRRHRACVRIQRLWRSYLALRYYLKLKRSAIKIEAFWRCHLQRKQFLILCKTAVLLQTLWRMTCKRKTFLQMHRSVLYVQSQRRMVVSRVYFLSLLRAACEIQSFFRRYLARKQFTKICEATRLIQRRFRRYMAAQRILANIRGYLERKHYLTKIHSILTMQRLVRRWFARKFFSYLCTRCWKKLLDQPHVRVISDAIEVSGPKLVTDLSSSTGVRVDQVRELSNVHVRAISLPGLTLLDTVGLYDIFSAQALVSHLRELPPINITSVIFVDRFDSYRIPEESLRALAIAFGPQIFERTIFSFTHADAPLKKNVKPEHVLQVKIAALSNVVQRITTELLDGCSLDSILSEVNNDGIPVCLFDTSEFTFDWRVDNPLNFASLRRLVSELLRQSRLCYVWSNVSYRSENLSHSLMKKRSGNYYSYFHTLGVSPSATFEEIRRTYRRLVLKYHPDRNRGPDENVSDVWWNEEMLLSFCFEVSLQTSHGKYFHCSEDDPLLTCQKLSEVDFWSGKFAISTLNGRFLTLDRNHHLVLQRPPAYVFRDGCLNEEVFEMPAFLFSLKFFPGKGFVTIKAPNGRFVSATKKDNLLIADRTKAKGWEIFSWRLNPSFRHPCYTFDDIVHNQFVAIVHSNNGLFWESDTKLKRIRTRGQQMETAERILFEFCGFKASSESNARFPEYRLRCGDGRVICAGKDGRVITVQTWERSQESLLLQRGRLVSRFSLQFKDRGRVVFSYSSNYEDMFLCCDERRGILSSRLTKDETLVTFVLSFLFEDYETIRRIDYLAKDTSISETESMVSENS